VYGNAQISVLKPLMITCNRILRSLQDKSREYPVSLLYSNYNTLPVNLLFKFVILTLVHRCYHNQVNDCLPCVIRDMFILNRDVHSHNTRSSSQIHLFHNTSNCTGPYVLLGSVIWNNLTESLKLCRSLSAFKKNLKVYLGQSDL